MKTLLPILSFFLLVQISCNKDDNDSFTPTLPPITQTGENTFGCYIDGKLLVPRDGTGTFNTHDHGMVYIAGPGAGDITYHEIDVHDYASERTGSINLHFIELDSIGVGQYTVNESNCDDGIDSPITNNIYCRVWNNVDEVYKYYCSVKNSGVINISRYDFENRIISGTFSCTVVNQNEPNDTVEITDGRFDIKWDELPITFP